MKKSAKASLKEILVQEDYPELARYFEKRGPILRERTTESEHASIVGLMSKKVPPERLPALIQSLFPLLDLDDQVVITKGWMTLLPPQVFTDLKPLIKKTVAKHWIELARRIPELEEK